MQRGKSLGDQRHKFAHPWETQSSFLNDDEFPSTKPSGNMAAARMACLGLSALLAFFGKSFTRTPSAFNLSHSASHSCKAFTWPALIFSYCSSIAALTIASASRSDLLRAFSVSLFFFFCPSIAVTWIISGSVRCLPSASENSLLRPS